MKITEAVGAYGAALSTFVAYRQWRAARPHLTITTVPAYNGPGHDPQGVFVRANVANHGTSPVHIRPASIALLMDWGNWRKRLWSFFRRGGDWRRSERLGIALPNGTIVTPVPPASIEPGQALVIWLPFGEYERMRFGPRVHGMQFMVQDQVDRTTYSTPVPAFGAPALPRPDIPIS
jgi:hypothetical protein